MHFKDQPALVAAPLDPARPFRAPLPGGTLGAMARCYNRVGGLVQQLALAAELDALAVLAVWLVESAGLAHAPDHVPLRFDCHRFYAHWGRANEALFDRHFQFGGRQGVPGKPEANHKVRHDPDADDWETFRGNHEREQRSYALAARLAGPEAAAKSTRFGAPLICGRHHDACGYASAQALRGAFLADERWQLLGLFDLCAAKGLLGYLRGNQWKRFAAARHGESQRHGLRLAENWGLRDQLLALPRA